MKVLFIINQLGGGGAERVLTIIANHMAEEGIDVSILSFTPSQPKYKINSLIHLYENEIKHKTAIRVAYSIRKVVKEIKPSIIISFEYHMNMKMLLGTIGMKSARKIISERNDPARKGGQFGYRQARELLYRSAELLVCQTEDAKSYFSKEIQNHTVIIPNPVSDEIPDPWDGEREKRIVNFCRLEKQKNIPLLIDAFEIFAKNHDEYKLEIYGDGSLKDELKGYISDKGLCDKVTIFSSSPEIHHKVLKAAMFVSASDYEGISNSMLESMAMGIPTICTDCPCGGARMIIEDGKNGFLTQVGNAQDIAYKMAMIADNFELSKRLSKKSVLIREELSSKKIVDKWMKEVLASKNG